MLVTEGGVIAQLSEESSRKLNEFLPSHWSRSNPVDLLGDATVDRFVKAVEIVSADSSNDGILVILTPQAMTDATAIAKGLSAFNKIPGKPILASWMGASEVTQGEAILNASAIPTFEYPDTAARSFCYIAIIAVRNEPKTKEDEIIGVGRLIKVHGVNDAEFAIVLSDQWQGHGLGSHFLKLLLEIGRQEGSEHVIGQMLPDNYAMQRICKKLGFAMSYDKLGEVVEAKIKL
jgi:acyl-CoA synthetase (NDP forming)